MNKLKELRKKYGLTQRQVAEKLIYSLSQIRRLENSDIRMCDLSDGFKLEYIRAA